MRACERCHSRKTKCDRRMPSCTSCTKSQVPCQYPNKWRDRQLRQEYIKSVEQRLRELETENARLRNRDTGPEDTPMADTVTAISNTEHEVAMVMTMAATGAGFSQPQTEAIHAPSPSLSQSRSSPSPSPIPPPPALDVAPPSPHNLPPPASPPHPPLVSRLSPTQSSSSHRTPGEEARYLGSSNGVEFTDVVERVVDGSLHIGGAGSTFGRVADTRRGYGYGYGSGVGDNSDDVTSASAPTGDNSNTTAADNERMAMPRVAHPPTTLVDEGVAMPLVDSYFAHWHLTFPLLHRPMFLRMVRDLYANPRRYQEDAAGAFAFDIVLALGAVPAKRHVEWGLGFGDAERHFARALARLDAVAALRDIRALQALLLYCKYGIHASLRDTSSELWEALGQATQLVVELGLHQTGASGPTGAAAARLLPRCEVHITGPLPAAIRMEMQRRSFWCYYNLETIVNISLGRPLAIHDDDIDVPMPSTADDDEIGNKSTTMAGHTIESTDADANEHSTSLSTSSTPADTSLFLHHINYRRLQARIHRCMYTSRSVQTQPLLERQAARREIYKSLQEWQRDTARLNLQQHHHPNQPIRSSFLHPSWYQALYHSACLMLFRPSTAFPAMERLFEERSSGADGDEDVSCTTSSATNIADDPLHILWTASRGVLYRYSELLRARHFNYSWVTLYTIFMAGLANVYAVGCCAQRRKRWYRQTHQESADASADYSSSSTSTASAPKTMPFLPALLDTVCDFRDCSNILTAIGERWNDARAPYDTFARLSMSAMQELAVVTCQPRNGACACSGGSKSCVSQTECSPSTAMPVNGHAGLAPLPPLQPQHQSLTSSFAPFVHDGYTASGVVASPGLAAIYGVSMDDTFTPDHALADYYSMVDFQQLFHEM